jgi:hypothetical protein
MQSRKSIAMACFVVVGAITFATLYSPTPQYADDKAPAAAEPSVDLIIPVTFSEHLATHNELNFSWQHGAFFLFLNNTSDAPVNVVLERWKHDGSQSDHSFFDPDEENAVLPDVPTIHLAPRASQQIMIGNPADGGFVTVLTSPRGKTTGSLSWFSTKSVEQSPRDQAYNVIHLNGNKPF